MGSGSACTERTGTSRSCPSVVSQKFVCRPPMHPVPRRCSSVKYSRYSPSSRLAGRAPRRPRCDNELPRRDTRTHLISVRSVRLWQAVEEIAPEVARTFRSARHGRPKGLHYDCLLCFRELRQRSRRADALRFNPNVVFDPGLAVVARLIAGPREAVRLDVVVADPHDGRAAA